MAVPDPAIASDFRQAFDIGIYLFPEFTFYPELLVDDFTEFIDLFFGEVFYFNVRGYLNFKLLNPKYKKQLHIF